MKGLIYKFLHTDIYKYFHIHTIHTYNAGAVIDINKYIEYLSILT